MKKILLGVALAVLAVSCMDITVTKARGKAVRGEFDVSTYYTALSVTDGITVILVEAGPEAAETVRGLVTTDEDLLEHLSIVETNGRVVVSFEPRSVIHVGERTVVRIPVSRRGLSEIKVSSAARVVSEVELECPELSVDCSSAARVDVEVDVRSLDIELGSSAGCSIKGRAEHCKVDVSSAARLRGFDLVCRDADIEASSAGSVEITVTEKLSAEVSSAASVRYKGRPGISSDSYTSSGGSLKSVN